MARKNRLLLIEVFKGLSPRTHVYFHYTNTSYRYLTPGQKSLDRLAKYLQGAKIMLNETGIYIQKWVGP